MIILKILSVVFFAYFYQEGGQTHPWVRRFIGGIGFGLSIWGLALLAHQLVLLVFLAGAWYCPSMIIFKYGVNDGSVLKKAVLRGVYGASLGLSGLLAGIGAHHAFLGVLQLVSAVGGCVYLGVMNPFSKYPKLGNKATRLEDICIALSCAGMVPFFF